MTIARSILPEFDNEMRSTRAVIALVTDELASYRPHPKAWTAGELSFHLANLLRWVNIALEGTEFDPNPVDGNAPPRGKFESAASTMAAFEANLVEARARIEATSDADIMVAWSLKSGGRTIFSIPRLAVLRSFVMNHLIHHRGQLTVYLRMMGVTPPEIYGPTADSAR